MDGHLNVLFWYEQLDHEQAEHPVYDALWGNYRSGSTSINNLWMFSFHHTHVSLKGVQYIIYEGKSPPTVELTCGDIRRCGVLLRLDEAHQRVFPVPSKREHWLWYQWSPLSWPWTMSTLRLNGSLDFVQVYSVLWCAFCSQLLCCLLPSVHTVSTAI